MLLTGESHLATELGRSREVITDDGLKAIPAQASTDLVGATPGVVREYIYPGNIPGILTHLEYVEAVR